MAFDYKKITYKHIGGITNAGCCPSNSNRKFNDRINNRNNNRVFCNLSFAKDDKGERESVEINKANRFISNNHGTCKFCAFGFMITWICVTLITYSVLLMHKNLVTIRCWQNSKMDGNVAIGFGLYFHNKKGLDVVLILNFTVWMVRMRQKRILNIPYLVQD